MTVKTRAVINSETDTYLADNTTRAISAEDVRQRVKDLADSAILAEDGPAFAANSPNANEFARFADADTIEGRTVAETRSDLGMAISAASYGAVSDGVIGTTGAITATDATFTDAAAAFVAGDVGKPIAIKGAGTAGAVHTTTIALINSATSVELTAVAVTTVTSAIYTYGTDDGPAIEAACEAAMVAGMVLRFTPGNYLIATAVAPTISGNVAIECDPGAVFIASGALAVDSKVFNFDSPPAGSGFRWSDGRIDGRAMPARSAGAPDLLTVASEGEWTHVSIEGCDFVTNASRISGTAGDSHIFVAGARNVVIRRNKHQGAIDAAIYISGDAAGANGKYVCVENNYFTECVNAVTSKRIFAINKIVSNFIEDCTLGITTAEADATTLYPGTKLLVAFNTIERTQTPIIVRIADDSVVIGNRILDFGIDEDGAPAVATAIALQGSARCIVQGNSIYVVGHTLASGSIGIGLLSRTQNSIEYDSIDNLIASNLVALNGTSTGIDEADNEQIGNRYLNNAVSGAAVLYDLPGSLGLEPVHDHGTKSSGTLTPEAFYGKRQKAINGGAHTLAPPTLIGDLILVYTNNASAGAITTSGFTLVLGDAFTTTNTDRFECAISYDGTDSILQVTRLQ